MDKYRKDRMLPSDFQKSKKENKLGNSEKDIIHPAGGFFLFPEELKGKQKIKDKKFLVFYFDNDEDYKIVREVLEKRSDSSNNKRSHPNMNSSELVRIVKQHGKK